VGVMAFYAAYLVVWAGVGLHLKSGWPYFVGLVVAAMIAGWHFTLIRSRSREGCFRAFRLNHWLGLAVFAGVVADSIWR
jgi:4-hydroxybenzoate polyprenyltransferase